MNKTIINICSENHHWINNEFCPYCGRKFIKTIEYRLGDCIKCGNLCPGYAYGCTAPEPIDIDLVEDQKGTNKEP